MEGPIKESRAMGELDHPDSSVINLQNVSHVIREVTWQGDDVVGLIEILPTPAGNILTSLFLKRHNSRCFLAWYGFINPNR